MSILNQMVTANPNEVEKPKDFVSGGEGFQPLESGIYKMLIDVVFIKKAASGALGVTVRGKIPLQEGEEPFNYRQTFYITSGDKKGNKNYYEKNGKTFLLPSYIQINELTNVLLGKSINELNPVDKNIKVYDASQQKEVTELLPTIAELSGKTVGVCIHKIRDNKSKKVGNKYVPTNEERLFNEVDKFLADDGRTWNEQQNGLEEPEFATAWAEKWEGEVKDLFKEVNTPASSIATSGTQSQALNLDIG